jgi:antitoxin component YwqK of YwqJK toxin-antitoxin module
MKKYFASIVLLFFVHQISFATFYDQLCKFNSNWKKYKAQAPAGEDRNFNSDKEYVQAHLSSVLPLLRTNPVTHLNFAQYHSRIRLIELLENYRIVGNFPVNYYCHERIPVFIDQHNTHCAVGYLLQQTGYEDMALRIAAADNYAWVKDIHDSGLPEWQKISGFSLEELKLIQGAYDSYMPNAFYLPNKYEIPQKPACMTAYFEKKFTGQKINYTWCHGEGVNGVLNGRWEQNYAEGMPWIVGYYEKGKRSGQWKEYYQGTKQLCRTENWRNDKLNGIRKRFNRSGVIIEEILFKDGNAITKTNYDLKDSLVWVRRPLDSNLVWTEIFTFGGALIAMGHEKVYNPGNLLWFQNIELTALNSISVSARSASLTNGINIKDQNLPISIYERNLYNSPPLVEYKKEGKWIYYKEYSRTAIKEMFSFPHFGSTLLQSIQIFDNVKMSSDYDSIRIDYTDDLLQKFYGYGNNVYTQLQIRYYDTESTMIFTEFNRGRIVLTHPPRRIKALGQYNQANQKIGVWKHYDRNGIFYKTENFIIPRKEEDDNVIVGSNNTFR